MSLRTPLERYLLATARGSGSSRPPRPGGLSASDQARLADKLQVYWGLAAGLAGLSRCRRLRVGTVVLRPDLTEVVAVGYNGPAAGEDNDACRGEEGACGCCHGEANALVKLKVRASGLALLCTSAPCEHCAGLIINSRRVGYVVYGEEYRRPEGVLRLARAGLVVVRAADCLGAGWVPTPGPEGGTVDGK